MSRIAKSNSPYSNQVINDHSSTTGAFLGAVANDKDSEDVVGDDNDDQEAKRCGDQQQRAEEGVSQQGRLLRRDVVGKVRSNQPVSGFYSRSSIRSDRLSY